MEQVLGQGPRPASPSSVLRGARQNAATSRANMASTTLQDLEDAGRIAPGTGRSE